MSKTYKQGFSLAETLVALIIIAEISIFSIPKLIKNQQTGYKLALFKETISTMNAMLYTGVSTGQITSDATLSTFFLNNINAVRLCATDSTTQGCWTQADDTDGLQRIEAGFILANGVSVAGFGAGGPGNESFAIDWNGIDGPNIEGDDQIWLRIFYVTSGSDRAGQIKAESSSAPSQTLFATFW